MKRTCMEPAVMRDAGLASTFEMLVERLSAMERKLDVLIEHTERQDATLTAMQAQRSVMIELARRLDRLEEQGHSPFPLPFDYFARRV